MDSRVYTVFPMSPCVPAGHVFEPVPADISSLTDSRKQLLDRIRGGCFERRQRGRGQCRRWAWNFRVGRVRPCPLQVTRERLSGRNKNTLQELAGPHVRRWRACWSDGVTRALPSRAEAVGSPECSWHVCAEELKEALGAEQELGTCATEARKLQRRGRVTAGGPSAKQRTLDRLDLGFWSRRTKTDVGCARAADDLDIISAVHVNVRENTQTQ